MRTSSTLLAALACLTSFTNAAPAIRHELQRVLQDVDHTSDTVVEQWRCDDDVDAEKKKKTKTKTKYKTSVLTSLSTTTTTTTACSSSLRPTRTYTFTPTVTSTNTKISFPPIISPTTHSSHKSKHQRSSSSRAKHSSSKSRGHLPPIIQPPHTHTESSSQSHSSGKKGTTITITPTATSTNTKISLPPVITATKSSSSSKHQQSTTTISPSPTSTKTSVHLPPIVPPPGTGSKSSATGPTTTSVSGIIPTASSTASAQPTHKPATSKRVRKALKKAGIIPSVIGDFKPSFLVDAVFTDKNENTTAKTPFLGDTLTPDAVQEQPLVRLAPPEMHSDFKVAYPTNNIIITLTDPDAPSHSDPKWSEICHWIAIGVPVKVDEDSTLGIQGQGVEILQDIVEYKPPGPPPHTGKHRYVLLAFTPRNATTEPLNLSVPSDRQHWGYGSKGHGVKDWAEDNGLLQIAGDYFVAEHQ